MGMTSEEIRVLCREQNIAVYHAGIAIVSRGEECEPTEIEVEERPKGVTGILVDYYATAYTEGQLFVATLPKGVKMEDLPSQEDAYENNK